MAAQNWLKKSSLRGVDGIVIAFGAPAIERSFARYLRGESVSIPIVFTWLEALDLGGHSVLVRTVSCPRNFVFQGSMDRIET
jgi:hypothetical protein